MIQVPSKTSVVAVRVNRMQVSTPVTTVGHDRQRLDTLFNPRYKFKY